MHSFHKSWCSDWPDLLQDLRLRKWNFKWACFQEGVNECSSRNAPDLQFAFTPTSASSSARWLTSKSAVLFFFFLLGVAVSGIKECYGTEKRKHWHFPHFSIWFPCQWLSRERLILLHPVLHSCAGAGCIPACWRKYYSFYPFPEGRSPSMVHLITAGYCDWNFHYNSACQGLWCNLFWSLTLHLLILLASLVGQEAISPSFSPFHFYQHNSVNRSPGAAMLIPSMKVLLVLLLILLQSLVPK